MAATSDRATRKPVAPGPHRLPANRRPLRDRPTPAVTIRVHLDTYHALKRMKRPNESFDQLIRLLMGRAVIMEEAPTAR